MASKQDIKTVAARSKLLPRREPHWHRISEGAYLGYRVMTTGKPGSWVARYRDRATGKQVTKALGDFSEHPDSKRYDLASSAAVEWFTHLGRGGSAKSYTVAEAAKEYITYTLSEHGEAAAKDMRSRVDRLVLSTNLECQHFGADVPLNVRRCVSIGARAQRYLINVARLDLLIFSPIFQILLGCHVKCL